MASTSCWSHLAWERTATPSSNKLLTGAVDVAPTLHPAPSDTKTWERRRIVSTFASGLGARTHVGTVTWTIISAGGAVREFVSFHPGSKSAAKTTTAETVKFVQVVSRPLVATMVTATMVCEVQEDVGATRVSGETPANCVTSVTTAPTAQSAAVGSREGVMRALRVLDSVSVNQAGRVIAARST